LKGLDRIKKMPGAARAKANSEGVSKEKAKTKAQREAIAR
jgi:hypothetical protein